jgi:aspartate beta-hydroxylase
VQELERQTPAIRAEYLRLKELQVPSDYVPSGEHKLHQGSDHWFWYNFIEEGRKNQNNLAQCPCTASALENIGSDLMTGTPFSFAFFSSLAPGSTITPHTAPLNFRLRVHLPSIVPKDRAVCGMRVAGEARNWEEGRATIFDDSYLHEVWHNGSELSGERVILLFDLWHWEVEANERYEIEALFSDIQKRRLQRSQASPTAAA